MKKLLLNVLIAFLAAGSMVLVSCNGDGGTNIDNTIYENFAGDYTVSLTPVFAELEATNPDAVIIEGDPSEMTYDDLITMVNGLIHSLYIEDGDGVSDMRFSFTAGHIFHVKYLEDGTWKSSADEDSDPRLYANYILSNGNLALVIPKELISIPKKEMEDLDQAQLNALLSFFNKGIVVFSNGNIMVNLRYKEEAGKLTLYVDKSLVVDTFECAIKAISSLEHVNPSGPDLAELLEEIEPFVEIAKNAIGGFSKINTGVILNKEPDVM